LSGIAPAQRGVPQIEVTFEVDANGILTINAIDKGTGKTESIKINRERSRLSPEEIQRMVDEAEKFAEVDKKIREKIESKNLLENQIYDLKGRMSDPKQTEKLTEEDKKTVQDVLEESRKWLDSNKETGSKDDFDEQRDKLNRVIHPIMSKLYAGAGGAPGGPGGPGEDFGADMPKHDDL